MPVMVSLPAISREVIAAPEEAKEEIPIAKTENTIHMKIDNIMK